MSKRSVRLKEFIPNEKKFMYADRFYDQYPDLERRLCYYTEADKNGFVVTGNGHFSYNKLILIGDSFVENNFTEADKRLNHILENLFIGAGLDIEVLNAGVSGSTLLNLLNVLINKIIHIKNSSPQGRVMVVLIVPSNDSNALRFQKSYWNDSQNYSNIIPQGDLCKPCIEIEENKNDFINILKIFINVCRTYEIEFYVSGIMHRYNNSNYTTINSWLRDFCIKHEINFIDMMHNLSLRQDFFYDDRHLLPEGASALAHLLFDQLKSKLDNTKSLDLSVRQFSICRGIDLTKGIEWSQDISVDMNSELSLWLNLKVIKKESYNSMLFCVDYYTQIQPGSTNLTFSPVVGWFSYINLQHEDNNACQFIKIQIPQGVTKLKIGICKWNQNAEIYVNDAFVKCISK